MDNHSEIKNKIYNTLKHNVWYEVNPFDMVCGVWNMGIDIIEEFNIYNVKYVQVLDLGTWNKEIIVCGEKYSSLLKEKTKVRNYVKYSSTKELSKLLDAWNTFHKILIDSEQQIVNKYT